jgi:hypothetical protein
MNLNANFTHVSKQARLDRIDKLNNAAIVYGNEAVDFLWIGIHISDIAMIEAKIDCKEVLNPAEEHQYKHYNELNSRYNLRSYSSTNRASAF